MPDKKINFEIVGRGFDVAKRHVDALTRAVNDLKRAGVDVDRVFKGKDLTTLTGAAKFGKEVAASIAHTKGLTRETQQLVKTVADQAPLRMLTSLRRERERYKRDLKEIATLEVKSRDDIITRDKMLLETATKLVGVNREMASLRKPTTMGVLRDLATPILSRLATPAGIIGMAAAAPIAIASTVGQFASGFAERRERAQTVQAMAAQIYANQAIPILRGQGQREMYFRLLGGDRRAREYADAQTRLDMIQRYPFSRALGLAKAPSGVQAAGEFVGGAAVGGLAAAGGIAAVSGLSALGVGGTALAAGLAATPLLPIIAAAALGYGAYRGIRYWTQDPKAIKEERWGMRYQEGRTREEQKVAIPMEFFEYAMERAGTWNRLKQQLGPKFATRRNAITPQSGALGPAMAEFPEPEVLAAANAIMQYGGAEAIQPSSLLNIMNLGRYHGIENAAQIAGRVGRFRQNVFSNIPTDRVTGGEKFLTEALVEAFKIGLADNKFQIERESYVEAVAAATERLGARYGFAGGPGPARAIGGIFGNMFGGLLPGKQMIDATGGALTQMEYMTGGSTGTILDAFKLQTVAELMEGQTTYRGLGELGLMRYLMKMPATHMIPGMEQWDIMSKTLGKPGTSGFKKFQKNIGPLKEAYLTPKLIRMVRENLQTMKIGEGVQADAAAFYKALMPLFPISGELGMGDKPPFEAAMAFLGLGGLGEFNQILTPKQIKAFEELARTGTTVDPNTIHLTKQKTLGIQATEYTKEIDTNKSQYYKSVEEAKEGVKEVKGQIDKEGFEALSKTVIGNVNDLAAALNKLGLAASNASSRLPKYVH